MAEDRRTVCTVDTKLRYFVEPLQEEYSSIRYMCTAFNVAFAKLLWLLVFIRKARICTQSIADHRLAFLGFLYCGMTYLKGIIFLFRLESKPPMPYRVWTEKLSAVVRQWYKALADSGRDLTKVAVAALLVVVHTLFCLFEHQCKQLPGKTRLQNDLLCVECDANLYLLKVNFSCSSDRTFANTFVFIRVVWATLVIVIAC